MNTNIRNIFAYILFFAILMPSGLVNALEPEVRGGSNYAWYNISATEQPAPPHGNNCREPYGIIKNYHQPGVRNIVKSQLSEMRANNQGRIRIPIFHMRGGHSGGTILDSTGGNLRVQDRENFQLFLADIKAAGFREVMVGFFPQGANSPINWSSWSESYFQENWNLIYNIRPIIVASGIQYRTDLMNEGSPASNQPILQQYVARLWGNYNYRFGKSDTVGFSMIASVNRYNTTVGVLNSTGYGLPYLWSIHAYSQVFDGQLQSLINTMNQNNDYRHWIIGETYYADEQTRDGLMNINMYNRKVWFILQWPITRNRGCDGHVDITPPINYIYDW